MDARLSRSPDVVRRARLYRDGAAVDEAGYLTDLFSAEATRFITKSEAQPFFLYLADYVALPPYQTSDLPWSEWSRGWDENNAKREDYASMVETMDEA